jgi:hypothetical protein
VSGMNRVKAFRTTLGLLATFTVIIFSLFFFRANTLGDSMLLLSNAFDFSTFKQTLRYLISDNEVVFGILMIIALLSVEYVHERENLVNYVASRPIVVRWALYAGFVFFILFFGMLRNQEFIYFQF